MNQCQARIGSLLLLVVPSNSFAQEPSPAAPAPQSEASKPPTEKPSKEELNQRANAQFQNAKKLKAQKDFDQAINAFKSAKALFQAAEATTAVAWMDSWIGHCHRDADDDESAVKAYRECLAGFTPLEDKRQRASGIAPNAKSLGAVLFRLKRYEEAISVLEQSAAAYAELDQAESVNAAWTHSYRGDCLRHLERDEEAVAAYRQSIPIFEKHEHWSGIADDAPDLAKSLKRLEKYDEAVPVFELAARAYEQTDRAKDAAWMHSWIGDCHRDAGDDASAVPSYRECLA